MPIRIQSDLPAKEILEKENIFVMDENRAMHQDIRPIKIGILNLMPLKEETELQLLRSLSNTPLQVDVTFVAVSSHESKNTSMSHLNKFYESFADIKRRYFDGLIITGAPVEQMEYEDVDYWEEICQIFEWTKSHVTSSRHTEVRTEDIRKVKELTILAESEEAGVFLAIADEGRRIFVMGHPEYDRYTLDKEYKRDKEKGLPIEPPVNYYPDDDDTKKPNLQWRSHGNILYSNWLNYYVYQQTPYEFIDTAEIIGK